MDVAAFGPRTAHEMVVFNGKLWILGGTILAENKFYNDVWSSSDGINWTQVTDAASWKPRKKHRVLIFENKIWLIGGVNLEINEYLNEVWVSENGADWTQVTLQGEIWSERFMGAGVVYRDKMWLLGGYYWGLGGGVVYGFRDVWSTEDGETWVEEDTPGWSARGSISSTQYDDKIWVVGGSEGSTTFKDVWYGVIE